MACLAACATPGSIPENAAPIPTSLVAAIGVRATLGATSEISPVPPIPPYPYPQPQATAVPTPRLKLPIIGLVPGARPRLAAAQELWVSVGRSRYHLVPVTADDTSTTAGIPPVVDVVLVRSDDVGSRQLVSVSELLGAIATGVETLAHSSEAVIETMEGRWFLDFGALGLETALPANSGVTLALPPAGVAFPIQRYRTSLRWLDWTGDGIDDPLLVYHPGDEPAQAAVFVSGPAEAQGTGSLPLAQFATIMEETDVLVDMDADGVAELVAQDEGGSWHSRRWDGKRFVAGAAIPVAGASAQVVTAEALPALPASIVFERDGTLRAWPSTGNALVTLTEPAQPDLGPKARGFAQGGTDRIVFLESWSEVTEGARADRTDLVVHDVDSGLRQAVLSWKEPLPVSHLAISGDGRWVTYLDGDCGGRGPGLARTLPVPTRGGSCGGTWYVVAAEAGAIPRALGTCTVHREREISIGCERSLPDPAGSRLAWGDDEGLWVVELPDGPPRQMTSAGGYETATSEASDQYVAALQRPDLWSADGRWLVTDGPAGVEGSVIRLWDMASLQEASGIGFCYVGCSELGWNLSDSGDAAPLVETNADSVAVTLRPSHAAEAQTATPLLARMPGSDLPGHAVPDGFAALGWSPGDPPRPFSPIVTPDGTLVFGVRHVSDRRYRGNALLSMTLAPDGTSKPDASDLHPIVTLPAMGTDDQGSSNSGRLGQVIWSADGSAWVFRGPSPPTADDPYGNRGYVWVGLTDGSAVWDASDVLRGALGIAWVPTAP